MYQFSSTQIRIKSHFFYNSNQPLESKFKNYIYFIQTHFEKKKQSGLNLFSSSFSIIYTSLL